MTTPNRPFPARGAPDAVTSPSADTLVMQAASPGSGTDTGFTTVMMRRAPKRPAARLGLSVAAAISGTVVASMLNVPPQAKIAAAVIGAAIPAFVTEPGRFQRQRIWAAGLLTVAALFVTYGGTTVFSYVTGKSSVYLAHSIAAPASPWAVITAYYRDITDHDYQAAWLLRGPGLRGQDYPTWAAGYARTGRQTVRKLSVSGDQVSFTLRSDNPDGTVQMYSGTDTVTGGKIMAAHVVLVSGPAQP